MHRCGDQSFSRLMNVSLVSAIADCRHGRDTAECRCGRGKDGYIDGGTRRDVAFWVMLELTAPCVFHDQNMIRRAYIGKDHYTCATDSWDSFSRYTYLPGWHIHARQIADERCASQGRPSTPHGVATLGHRTKR